MTIPAYDEALDWLNINDPFFTRTVLDLGAPTAISAEGAPRQAVRPQLSKEGSISLTIDVPTFSELPVPERAFLLSKAALQVLLQHPAESVSDKFPDKDLLGRIHEAAVAEMLLNRFYTPTEDAILGSEEFGVDLSTMLTADAYALLAPEHENLAESSGQYSSLQWEEPELLQQFGNKFLGAGVAAQVASLPEELRDLLENIPEIDAVQPDGDIQTSGGCSLVGQSEAEMLAEANPGSVEWVELLRIVNPEMDRKPGVSAVATRADWMHRPNRYLNMGADLHLPSRKVIDNSVGDYLKGGKPTLVLALDLSGSIPHSAAQKMAELARMVPEELITVHCCTFSTYHVPFDPTSDRNRVARGGTDFSAVEDFVRSIREDGDPYPTVVCVTDGEANFANQAPAVHDLEKKWHWLPVFASNRQFMESTPGGWGYGAGRKIFHQILPMTLI